MATVCTPSLTVFGSRQSRRVAPLTDLVSEAGDAPALARLVDGLDDGDVEALALPEHVVQLDLTQLGSGGTGGRRQTSQADGSLNSQRRMPFVSIS